MQLEAGEGLIRRARETSDDSGSPGDRLILVGRIGARGERGSGCPYLIEPIREQQLYETIRSLLPEVIAGTGDLRPRHHDRDVGGEPGTVPAILLAEDDPSNRLLATKILQQNGYRVISADNGQEALDILLRERVECVLMDLQMPVMDGITVTGRIRNGLVAGLDPDLPVIGLTAHAMQEHREKALASGMNLFLTKPFRREELLKALVAVRGGRQANPACRSAEVPPAGMPVRSGAEESEAGRAILDRYLPDLSAAHSSGDTETMQRRAEELRQVLQEAGDGPAADRVFRLILALRKADRERVGVFLHELDRSGVQGEDNSVKTEQNMEQSWRSR